MNQIVILLENNYRVGADLALQAPYKSAIADELIRAIKDYSFHCHHLTEKEHNQYHVKEGLNLIPQ